MYELHYNTQTVTHCVIVCWADIIVQYIAAIAFFGLLYTTVPNSCKGAIYTYFDGFSFSVSVLFTIGFGTNGGDVFFNECAWMQIIITLEVRNC